MSTSVIEQHPLSPFLPANARILLLGSFPPSQKRWSIPFYYPNWQNDMWRIVGQLFFANPLHFCLVPQKCYDKAALVAFLSLKGIALSDTAQSVVRLNNDSSDKFLQIVQPMDLAHHLRALPLCHTVVSTGGKSADEFCTIFSLPAPPPVGQSLTFSFEGRSIQFFRMPSSSRAYPRPLDYKVQMYQRAFTAAGLL